MALKNDDLSFIISTIKFRIKKTSDELNCMLKFYNGELASLIIIPLIIKSLGNFKIIWKRIGLIVQSLLKIQMCKWEYIEYGQPWKFYNSVK